MRIQHNIMAMSAYRNYTNNVSAMKKNLEKLSSGYKINRAGDDAAGLAISEKMRAQITGLETAQKNAKDGISLVQTAEGALTEVHDMLNRMVELATMSANGTYDNDTDRAQLQKELDQLNSEINRIADSANFNGIKLLNGNMQEGFDSLTAAQTALNAAKTDLATAEANAAKDVPDVTETVTGTALLDKNLLLPMASTGVGVVGTNTVLESNAGGGSKPSFSVAMDGLKHQVNDPTETFKLSVGGAEVKDATGNSIKVGGEKFKNLTSSELAELFNGAKVQVDSVDYTATVSGSNVVFEADAAPAAGAVKNPRADVTFTAVGETAAATNNGAVAKYEIDLTGGVSAGINGKTIDGQAITWNASGLGDTLNDFVKAYNADTSKNYTASVTGNKITLTAKSAGAVATAPTTNIIDLDGDGTEDDPAAVTEANKGEAVGTGEAGAAAKYEFDLTDGTTTGLNSKKIDGVDVTWNASGLDETLNDFVAAYNATAGKNYVASKDGSKIVLTARQTGEVTTAPVTDIKNPVDDSGTEAMTATEKVKGKNTMDPVIKGTTGSINVGTVNINFNTAATDDRLANTVLDMSGKFKDGTEVKLGDTTYVFANTADGKTTANAAVTKDKTGNTVLVDLTSLDKDDTDFDAKAASIFTQVAKNNATFSVGQRGGTKAGQVSLQQLSGVKGSTDMETKEGLTKYISVKSSRAATADEKEAAKTQANAIVAEKRTAVADAEKAVAKAVQGKSLTLQIGDTAEDFNQLKVDIKDMHAASLGQKYDENGNVVDANNLANIKIDNQDDAATAIDVIKRAINQVSDVRGTLGATQNRLDHTINNLSVMTENIQDAESTIRDVDVAEEMMAYTKNNILIQSAQAMLAQANQVPQGVLQLLQ